MSSETVKTPISKAVLAEAADYYLKLQDGDISGAELKAWQAWFLRSEAHQRAFKRLETLHGALDQLSVDAAGAIAAAKQKAITETGVVAEITGERPSSIIGLVTEGMAEKPKNRSSHLRVLGSIAATFLVVAAAAFILFSSPETAGIYVPPVYTTAAEEQRVVTLADGSVVELAVDSSVSIHYSKRERRLTLDRGQAIFTVAKNPDRPFVVEAGTGTVTAIGTVFNVRRTSGDVAVKVLEGTVAVRPIATSEAVLVEADAIAVPHVASQAVALVTAGRQTVYTHEGTMKPVEETDVHADLEWRIGVLTMVNQRLSSVIRDLNRFLENEIAIGDDGIGDYVFTGTVYPDQVDAWLEGLQKGYPIKVVRLGSSTILMPAEAEVEQVGT